MGTSTLLAIFFLEQFRIFVRVDDEARLAWGQGRHEEEEEEEEEEEGEQQEEKEEEDVVSTSLSDFSLPTVQGVSLQCFMGGD